MPDIDGDKVHAARKDAKLTQKTLGGLVRSSHVHISHIENGNRQCSEALAKRIAKACGVSWESLLAGDNNPPSETSRLEQDVLAAIRSLPPDKRGSIRAYAVAFAQAWQEAKEKGWEH